MAVLRIVGKTATTVIPVAQLARLGWPGLIVLVAVVAALALLLLGTLWWVIGSDARSARAERLLLAVRGRRQ